MEHVEHTGERKCAYRVLVGKLEGKKQLERPSLDERIILKWIFKKWDGACTGLIRLRIGTCDGLL